MERFTTYILISISAVISALPIDDPVISKLGNDLRYQYMRGPNGTLYLVDRWLKASDITNSARYNPDLDNVYHLFTRENALVSQPLFLGNEGQVRSSNFNPRRRTIYLIHGWIDTVRALFNEVLVPAFLEAEDVNVIAVDWGIGAWTFGEDIFPNAVKSGLSGARFINWLNSVTGASPVNYHIVGYSLGGFQAGVVSRNVNGNIAYVSALDPVNGLQGTEYFFTANVGAYTEAIHTTPVGTPMAHVDFYPNGGENMPICEPDDYLCNHESCFYYMAESLEIEYIGQRCATYEDARVGSCDPEDTLRMGGLVPKTGSTGLYYLRINSATPFSSSLLLILVTILSLTLVK